MDSSESDPYVDPATGILRNLVGARARDALSAAEGDLVFARLVQLTERPPLGTGDLAEMQAIHRQLFQDVFDWVAAMRPATASATGTARSERRARRDGTRREEMDDG